MIKTAALLKGVRVLLFDVMGTVVDVDGTARRTAIAALGFALTPEQAAAAVEEWNRAIDARISDVVAGSAPWRPHAELRAEALRAVLSTFGLTELPADTWAQLDAVVQYAEPWSEAPAALARLRESLLVVALSNAGVGELAALSQHGGLAWHAMVSAEVARSFKPASVVYLTAIRLLGVRPAETLMVAAHPWDLRAAAQHGMATAFVARPGAEMPAAEDHFSVEVKDLSELAATLEKR